MKKIKILLADDHSFLRVGLKTLIATEADMSVVGEATNGKEAVKRANELKPDVVIMDLMMPGMSGAEATAAIRQAHPDTHILILTSFGTSRELVDAIAHGADGVVLKDAASDELTTAVRQTAQGAKTIPAPVAKLLEEARKAKPLTPSQHELLLAVARGLTDKEIADMLKISISGTKHRMRGIFNKIGAANRAEAVAIALRKQLLKI